MGLFQVLSTKIEPDGWMDINVSIPSGVVSVKFRFEDQSVESLYVSNYLYSTGEKPINKNCDTDDGLIESLLTLVEGFINQNGSGRPVTYGMADPVHVGKDLSKS